MISDFSCIIKEIDNQFDSFLDYDNLAQSRINPSHYCDLKYNCWFFHDFDQYKTLNKQYKKVYDKYNRRIKRFLDEIKKPTLFIRYVKNDSLSGNKSEELIWIENNINYIFKVIKRSNPKNDIIFISDEKIKSNVVKLYNVVCDENDVVCREPLIKNKIVNEYLSNLIHKDKENNIKRYHKKLKSRNKLIVKLYSKLKYKFKKYFYKPVIHSNLYIE